MKRKYWVRFKSGNQFHDVPCGFDTYDEAKAVADAMPKEMQFVKVVKYIDGFSCEEVTE